MKWQTSSSALLVVVIATLVSAVVAQASTTLPVSPAAIVASETLYVPFTRGPAGIKTQQSYSGQVQVTISGVGQAAGSAWSDAFYVYTDPAGNPSAPWHSTAFYNSTLWINDGPADWLVWPTPPYSESQL